MATINDLVAALYQQQLGRESDVSGAEYFASRLASGATEAEIAREMAQSLEGQNLLTQAATSAYRQALGRNPEQQGYQYWATLAQEQGLSAKELQDAIKAAAVAEQTQRGITGGFTDMQLAALEADPYGGRYATQSIYDLLPDAVNLSTVGGRQAQFVAPVTQPMFISQLKDGKFTAQQGVDVLNTPAVQAAVSRAIASGTMDQSDYNTLLNDLTKAKNAEETRAAFAKPQGQVVIDAIYGQQTGEAKTLAEAQAEALQRQAVLSAQDPGYYQSNFALTDAYRAAGLDFPFGPEAYQGYDTRPVTSNVVTPANFQQKVNQLIGDIRNQYTSRFGVLNDLQTPLTGQYYSETGLQPGFTPIGTEGTTFRSGVAGYTPNLPTGFQFGAPLVNATFQPYKPGAFQPEGVATGGFITGYDANQQPIYSTYNNPNVNVGGVPSTLNPFINRNVQLDQLMNDYNARQAVLANVANSQGGG